MTDYPAAYSVKIEPNPHCLGSYLWTVACPYCGKTHTHGGSETGNQGHRAAHCAWKAPTNNGYILQERMR